MAHLVAARELPVGTIVDESMVAWADAGGDAHSLTLAEATGRRVSAAIRAGQLVTLRDLSPRVVAMISSRLGSRRLPRKALLPLAGHPAIEHLIDRVVQARRVDRVVLCTSTNPENDALEEVARRKGIGCFRGSEDDVLERFTAAAIQERADVVVRVTGDDLFTDPRMLDAAVEHHLTHNADYTQYPGLPKGLETEIISTAALRFAHERAVSRELAEHLTYWVHRPEIFRVSTMPVDDGLRRPYSLTLDDQEDYQRLQSVFDRLYAPGRVFTTEDLLALIDAAPELQCIPARKAAPPPPPLLRVGEA